MLDFQLHVIIYGYLWIRTTQYLVNVYARFTTGPPIDSVGGQTSHTSTATFISELLYWKPNAYTYVG